ncbi:MAG: hypothetical protein E3J52_09620 [Promethearchaeota archaeon]|nr:MAG: hypothetical protein E3J52_09620 [Candidatus Lokiarchaeota archaeon]
MIGLGLMFGLAFIMNLITFNKTNSFFVWLVIFNAIMVWGGLLELWTLILCIIILCVIIFFEMKTNKGGG